MRPHQGVSARPFEIDLHHVADRRRVARPGLELVDDLPACFSGAADRPATAVRGPEDQPTVGGLSAATRVEHRPVEDDQRRLADLDMTDGGVDRLRVGVAIGDLLAWRRHSAVRLPFMLGWTSQTNVYSPAGRACTS